MSIAHICLVSGQPLVNILPALIDDIKPEKIFLLSTQEQQRNGNAEAQKRVLKDEGFEIEIIPLEDAYDLEGVQQAVDAIISRNKAQYRLLMNATGGTKPMSIAAYELCFNDDIEVFYLDKDHIIWLHNPSQAPDIEVSRPLELRPYLNAHGIEVIGFETTRIPQNRLEIAAKWADAARGKNALGSLNYLAMGAKTTGLKAKLAERDDNNALLSGLLLDLEGPGFIDKQEGAIRFRDEDARFFANGGWLEEWLFHELTELQKKYPVITTVARNVKVELHREQTTDEVGNELDVVAIIGHRMWVFECKTKRMSNANAGVGDEKDVQHMTYKLGGLMKSLGGLRTQGCVVSFNEIKGNDRERAKLFEISTVQGSRLANLRSELVNIMRLKKA